MSLLEKALRVAAVDLPAAGVDCLLIGGFAVNHYGYTRNTVDVDFMIAAADLDTVRGILRAAGFSNIDVRENVAFFAAPDAAPRVDFLRVDPATMHRLLVGATAVNVLGHALRVPSLRDLVAMKIFAFSRVPARRMGKDLPDIAYLCVLNDLDVERDIRPLCDRYGTEEVLGMIRDQVTEIRSP